MELQGRRGGKESADYIYERFLHYKAERDFVGMDVARNCL
jgi:hypothetical protein